MSLDAVYIMRMHALLAKLQAAHFDEVLGDFGYALLALVDGKVRPVDKFIVDLRSK